MASQTPTSCSVGDFGFINTRLLQHRQSLQYRTVSSKEPPAAFPSIYLVGLFPSRVPSVRYLFGNNSSLHPRRCISRISVTATSLSFLDLRPGVEERALPWVYCQGWVVASSYICYFYILQSSLYFFLANPALIRSPISLYKTFLFNSQYGFCLLI